MSNKEAIAKLVFSRKVPLNRLKEISDYAKNSTADQFYKENLLSRADFVEPIYSEFQTYHNEIVSLISNENEFDAHDKIRVSADTYFYGIKSKIMEITAAQANNPSQSSSSRSGTKLPTINVPNFDGDLKSWPAFFDLYKSIIHDNSGLTQVEKFHYLMTSIKNEPFNLLKAIPVIENNYQIAYDTLVGRYQNKRFLATTYFNEIYTAQQLQRPSSKELRHLLDIFAENLAALKVLNFDVDSWDFIIFNILLQKIDSKTRTDFELEHSTIEMPTFNQLITFLTNQCKALESVQCMMPLSNNKPNPPKFKHAHLHGTVPPLNPNSRNKPYIHSVYHNQVGDRQNKCIMCPASHALYRCHIFLSKIPSQRSTVVRQNKLCENCLRPQHFVENCQSSTRCRICQSPHHTLLHSDSKEKEASTSSNPNTALQSLETMQCNTCTTVIKQSTVLLSTANVQIRDFWGNFQTVRVLLDSGSMANFITTRCVNRLGLKRKRFSVPIEGLNNLTTSSSEGITQCFIKPCDKEAPTFHFEAVILPKVCSDQPKVLIDPRNWSHIEGLSMADSNFQNPGPVDILLGAELLPFLQGPGRIFGKPGQPAAIETAFGWILQGRTECVAPNRPLVSCHASIGPQIDLLIQKFWEIEQVSTNAIYMSPDDVKCETIYEKRVSRDDTGRFTVPLPFRNVIPDFGDTYSQALRRFTYLESRFYKNPNFHKLYSDFIKEYIENKYISEVPSSDYRSSSSFYLPHHSVMKPDSASTKLRVVFDASAKGSRGLSLNDSLLTGPKLHQDLSAILHQFRVFPVVFVCDIKQMYCQIFINPEHRKFQRFLWRFSPTEKIKEYTLERVTFGVSAAPYLAIRTLRQLAIQEQDNHPVASKFLQNSVYVDDCIGGACSIKEALYLQQDLITLLRKGGFELRKWASNHPAILSAVPCSDIQLPLNFDIEGPSFVKVLGLQWNPTIDVFSYSCTPIESACTKRNVLSQIARIFDPLGFLAPTVFLAKRILQQLWLSETDWDDVPPDGIVRVWNRFRSELSKLSKIQLPRILFLEAISRLEIHGFCDASSAGYGCVIYFRFITPGGVVKISLVSAKSKVAPLRVVSLPRLELCAAVLLANLLSSVRESYLKYYTFDAIFAWSDSQVVLAWLSSSPHRWQTFVANRVAHVQEIIHPSSWRYVPTDENAADCVSRGISPLELLEHNMWWNGPAFLLNDSSNWPEQPFLLEDNLPDISQEEKSVNLQISIENPSLVDTLLLKFSSLYKIQRIVAYILRFLAIVRKSTLFSSKDLSYSEIHEALEFLIKKVQNQSFSDIFSACKRDVPQPKPFRKLAPFIDDTGILRVGGRLKRSSLPFDAKHPILMPKNHLLTDLIIDTIHRRNFHPGMKTMHNLILQTYWIISPRSAIYRCLSKCMKCFRSKPHSYTPVMADLPAFRVSQIKAFSKVCIDYAGPFTISMGKYRGAKPSKAYICLFVCCATKALHLELASDLSTEAFLACLRRFVARRGRVSDIYSDQGTNFKGAYNQLIAFSKEASQSLNITWHFNPPGAPHFNGLSEAGVNSVKTHIHRVIGEQTMTYEEFYTLLTQIESLLNSRPLSAISDDPNDLTPLTPGHFLTLEPLSTFPQPDLLNIPLNRLTRWQMLLRMHSDFWKRWNQEYLHTLQQRSKWTKSVPNINLNHLVLIKDEQRPPLKWALGRVVKLHPGEDGVVRVVTLKTQNGTLQRPVVKLCPLPGQ